MIDGPTASGYAAAVLNTRVAFAGLLALTLSSCANPPADSSPPEPPASKPGWQPQTVYAPIAPEGSMPGLDDAKVQEALDGKTKPNIVLMMMDNVGWGEIGTYGGGILRGAETPRIDSLATDGMKLLNYNVEPQCTPSRSASMTGRFAIRSGTTHVVWGMLYGLTQWEVTVAEVLSDAGYATGMYGKWHLGDIQGRLPNDQGFDEWFGVPNTTDESMYKDGFQYDPKAVALPNIMEGKKGEALRGLERSREAVDAYLELMEINPFDIPGRVGLMQAARDAGEDELAERQHRALGVLGAMSGMNIDGHDDTHETERNVEDDKR